jgi:hypothetical protein
VKRQELYADQKKWLPVAIIGGCFVTGAVLAVAGRAGVMAGVWLMRRADLDVMWWPNVTGDES